MRKVVVVGTIFLFAQGVTFAQDLIYKPLTQHKPTTLSQYRARTIKRVDWAEAKVKQLGRVKAVLFFNRYDKVAPVDDYVFAYVCNAGKNDHFVLANKKQHIVFQDFYHHPNHVLMRAAYKKNPHGAWVDYPNPITKQGVKPKKKYTYVRLLPQYQLCIGSGFSFS